MSSGVVLLGLLTGWAQAGPAEVPATGEETPAAATAAPARAVTLADCLAIALEQQPGLAAHRASVAAAYTQRQGLHDLKIPPILIARELPIRRKQSNLGIAIAEAGLNQAEWEALYAVKRLYLAVLFAREQKRVADDIVQQFRFYQERVKKLVRNGESRKFSENTVKKITAYLGLAENRQAEAERGIERALAALREAMGVEQEFCFTVPEQSLPDVREAVARDQVVQFAITRRGELVQAVTALAVTNLEVDAQGTTHLPTARTFASVVDIHARPIPQGNHNGEYRPAAVGLEMPPTLAGTRSARIQRAKDLSARAAAVVDKTRNLIVLEAEDTFLHWQETARKVKQSLEAATAAIELAEDARKGFRAGLNENIEELLANDVLAGQAQSAYNEARYQHGIALAALERVTAGGIQANADSLAPSHSK